MKTRYVVDYDFRPSIYKFSYERETAKSYLILESEKLMGWMWLGSRYSKDKPSFETFAEALEALRNRVTVRISRLEEELAKHRNNLQEIEDAQASRTDTTNS